VPQDPRAAAGALDGVRVLDLSSVVMGPMATQILGDLGADVITIESATGDTNRAMGPGPHPQLSGISLNLLRNKRNIAIDLKQPRGRDILLRLAATCDVFVTNLRPGPLARLGAAYDDIAAVRPDIVYCQAQGFPSGSDRAEDPAYDDIIQSATGVADATRRAYGEPALVPSIFADKVAGLTIVYAVLAALFHRERTGQGQHLEVPMTDAVKAFMLVEHGAGAIPQPPMATAGYARVLTPQRRPQATSDGWVNVLPYSKQQYDTIFAAGGRDDLIGDERYATGRQRIANSDFLYEQVRGIIATRTTAEWLDFCKVNHIPATKVVTLDEIVAEQPVAEHPVAGSYRQVRPAVRMSATPIDVRRHAPLPGEHNAEVMSLLGYSADEVAELTAAGVLRPGVTDSGRGTPAPRR
jgi:crotonobetainyl-CoA:carnitine CoA-transferase CaiB-like acyl-CoA transferase